MARLTAPPNLKTLVYWSDTAIEVAYKDLLENGKLFISYTPEEEPNHERKLRELDFYLARRGLRFNRELRGGWMHYELVEAGPPLILCVKADCMNRADIGLRLKDRDVTVPCCKKHKVWATELLLPSIEFVEEDYKTMLRKR